MNRRDWLKMLAAAAPTAVVYSHLDVASADDAFLIITDEPDRVMVPLVSRFGTDACVRQRRIAPSPQDLTIVRNGRLVDPRSAPGVDRRARDLLAYLRRRRTPGTHLVTVDAPVRPVSHVVQFEVDGVLVESVDRRKTYRDIVVPGDQGLTVFALEEGRLCVVRSSCRHELCRRSGAVRSGRIVCVPNRLVASIDGPGPAYDAITG